MNNSLDPESSEINGDHFNKSVSNAAEKKSADEKIDEGSADKNKADGKMDDGTTEKYSADE